MSYDTLVSICIVNWNTRDLLYNCLKSINERTRNITYEVIVVDNNSNDRSVEMLKKEFPEHTIIVNKMNIHDDIEFVLLLMLCF